VFSLLAYGSEMLRRLFRPYFFEHFGHFSELRRYAGYGTYSWAEKFLKSMPAIWSKPRRYVKRITLSMPFFFSR